MSKAACKCKEHECEECPEWIFTLADLIMCMMGLFVILWVLKPDGAKKNGQEMDPELVRVIAKIREAFDYLPDPQSKDPVDIYLLEQKLMQLKPHKGPGDGGDSKLERKGAVGDQPEVQSVRPGKDSIVGSRVLFEPGSADLSPEATRVLDEIAKLIRGKRNVMLVKGHAWLDEFPEDADPSQRLDLSIRRANAVANYLTSHGVDAEILRVVGCSTHEPVKLQAYTPEEKQLNRRVEVESTTTLAPEFQGHPAAGAPSKPAAESHAH
jgi:outer membrane protein OmpA-like peptidoglycan-associated protein